MVNMAENKTEYYECNKCHNRHFRIAYKRTEYDTIAVKGIQCIECGWLSIMQIEQDAWLYG